MRPSKLPNQFVPSLRGHRSSPRRGATILELVVGAVILGVFISSAGPMIHWVKVSRRTNEQHLVALQELSNQMEALAALPSSQLTQQHLQGLTISRQAQQQLSDASLIGTISEPADGLRRLTLEITWKNESGTTGQPERLTAWFRASTPEAEGASS